MVLVIGGVASGKRTFVRSLDLREADLFDCALAAPGSAASGAEASDGKSPGAEGSSAPASGGGAPARAVPSDGAPASAETWDAARARLATCIGVVHLEEALRPGGMFADAAPDTVASALAGKRVVACCEVGSGVVPVDADARAWRERVGRVCCALAARSDAVVRMVCGIPQVLKGSLDGLAGKGCMAASFDEAAGEPGAPAPHSDAAGESDAAVRDEPKGRPAPASLGAAAHSADGGAVR